MTPLRALINRRKNRFEERLVRGLRATLRGFGIGVMHMVWHSESSRNLFFAYEFRGEFLYAGAKFHF